MKNKDYFKKIEKLANIVLSDPGSELCDDVLRLMSRLSDIDKKFMYDLQRLYRLKAQLRDKGVLINMFDVNARNDEFSNDDFPVELYVYSPVNSDSICNTMDKFNDLLTNTVSIIYCILSISEKVGGVSYKFKFADHHMDSKQLTIYMNQDNIYSAMQKMARALSKIDNKILSINMSSNKEKIELTYSEKSIDVLTNINKALDDEESDSNE